MKKITQLGKLYETRIFLGVIIFVIILFIALILCSNLKSLYSGKSDSNNNSQDSFLEEESLSVTFLDAGKADAIVLHTNNSTVLIDTGLKSGGKELVQLIKSQGIDTIDYLILTHFDKDHVGGAARVIKKLKVNNIITSDYFKDSDEVEDYLEAAQICNQLNINEFYQYIPNLDFLETPTNIAAFVAGLKEHTENKVEVAFLTGEAYWYSRPDIIMKRIDYLTTYNENEGKDAPIKKIILLELIPHIVVIRILFLRLYYFFLFYLR